jgi:hypothetical protein
LRVAVHEGRLYSQSKVVGNVELGERCIHVGIDDGESVNANHHKHTHVAPAAVTVFALAEDFLVSVHVAGIDGGS